MSTYVYSLNEFMLFGEIIDYLPKTPATGLRNLLPSCWSGEREPY